jgi:hypothetical protein
MRGTNHCHASKLRLLDRLKSGQERTGGDNIGKAAALIEKCPTAILIII